jgi:hypothetical protein
MDKRLASITIRVPDALKEDYERLPAEDKTRAIKLMLDVLAKTCWTKLHYDTSFYFGEGFNVED